MPKRGKKYLEAKKKVTAAKKTDFTEAVKTSIDSSFAKFDETIDVASSWVLTRAMPIRWFAAPWFCRTVSARR